MTAELISKHIAHFANVTAKRLAEEAKTNVELRDALRTVKLGANTVRIGKFDIARIEDSGETYYNISSAKTGELIIANMILYDTCKNIVSLLNKGYCLKSSCINEYIRDNERLIRAMADIYSYNEMISSYDFEQAPEKLEIIENRLEVAMTKADLLRKRLLSK